MRDAGGRPKALAVLTVVALAVIGASVPIALSQDSGGSAGPTGPQPPAQRVDSRISAAYAVFASAGRSSKSLPPLARGSLSARDGNTAEGASPDLAAPIGERGGSVQSFLVPGQGSLCLTLATTDGGGAGSGCVGIDDAVDRGLSMTIGDRVYGAVPDWVRRVDVARTDGRTSTATVVNNGFEAEWKFGEVSYAVLVGDDGRRQRTPF